MSALAARLRLMTAYRSMGRSGATGIPGQIRIIAGKWRSRRIAFVAHEGLRPTPDRVRETLFNWLGQQLEGQACLDLFAGAGALGLEALSRGAASVTFVEQHPAAVQKLRANLQLLGADNARVLRIDALEFLHNSAGRERFDLVFLDPPFAAGLHERALRAVSGILAPGGLVYVEAPARLTDSAVWIVEKSGKAGNVHFHLLRSAPS